MRATRPSLLLAGALILSVCVPIPTSGQNVQISNEAATDNFRISNWLFDGWEVYEAGIPDMAYNEGRHSFLAVWEGNTLPGELENPKRAIFAQTIYGYNGKPAAAPYLVSQIGEADDVDADAKNPAVACSSENNNCLVVWEGTADPVSGTGRTEIYGQLIEDNRWFRGEKSFKLSRTDLGPSTTPNAVEPDVVYNAVDDVYYVVWVGDSDQDDNYDLFARTVDAATGSLEGSSQNRITNVGIDEDPDNFVRNPAVAHDFNTNKYLVAIEANLPTGVRQITALTIAADKSSIVGATASVPYFDGDTRYPALMPHVAYDGTNGQYLVTWSAVQTPHEDNPKVEIFGRRFSNTGSKIDDEPIRISQTGPDDNQNLDAIAPSAIYNPDADEFLVVWQGTHGIGSEPEGEQEIFGQRLNPDGVLVGNPTFRISTMGDDGDKTTFGRIPVVSYGTQSDEYLVIWEGSYEPEFGVDIFGRLLDDQGDLQGDDHYPIRNLPAHFLVYAPAVAHNWRDNEYLVVWSGNNWGTSLAGREIEIWGRRIDAETGDRIGREDFRISWMGPEYDPDYYGRNPDVVYNERNEEYVVVWRGQHKTNTWEEIFGRRINATDGSLIGDEHFLISEPLAEGDRGAIAIHPAIAYSSHTNIYLVAWQGYLRTGDLNSGEIEIIGRRIGSTGQLMDDHPFRISQMGPEEDRDFSGRRPDVVYNPARREFFVVWDGVNNLDAGSEVYAQRIDELTGHEVGSDDLRISVMGQPGSNDWAYSPAVEWNSVDDEYLVVWSGADNRGELADGEEEVFGQRLNGLGDEIGTDDFRISTAGPDLNDDYSASQPAVAHDPVNNEYLVVWEADDDADALRRYEYEIYGRRYSGQGTATTSEFRISTTADDGNALQDAYDAAVVYNPTSQSFLTVWDADHIGEQVFEIYGAILDSPPQTSVEPGSPDSDLARFGEPYPNPFSSNLTWQISVDRSQAVRIKLVDLLGRSVVQFQSQVPEGSSAHRIDLVLADLPAGVYMLVAEGEDFQVSRSLIKTY